MCDPSSLPDNTLQRPLQIPTHPTSSIAHHGTRSIRPPASCPSPPRRNTASPPHNIEAEQALLGAILVNNEAFYRVSDFLEPEHFFEPLHQQHLRARLQPDPRRQGRDADHAEDLPAGRHRHRRPQRQPYLARLAAEATTVINAADYGRTIYDLAMRRNLIRIGEDMVNVGLRRAGRLRAARADRGRRAQALRARRNRPLRPGFQRFAQALTTAVDMAAHAYQRDGKLSGLATGLNDLDAKMGGLQSSDLIIVAGRPGMGKTALATNIAYNVAKACARRDAARRPHRDRQRRHRRLLLARNVGRAARHPHHRRADRHPVEPHPPRRHHRSRLRDDQGRRDRIADACRSSSTRPAASRSRSSRARARRLKRQRGLDLLVIDYIQLLSGSARKRNENRVQEVTEITTGLKALAKELNVPIMALSQLSRQVESRDDKRPQLSDLRESGSIEQDADVVMFVFREEYYLEQQGAAPGHRRALQVADRDGDVARQGRGHHRQAAPRPDRHRGAAVRRRTSRASTTSRRRSDAGADRRLRRDRSQRTDP